MCRASARAEAGFAKSDGRLYAATEHGVWRTPPPVVSAEAWPTLALSGLSLTPDPSRGAVARSLAAREPQRARVTVTSVTGRGVTAAEARTSPEGRTVVLDVSGWAAGADERRAAHRARSGPLYRHALASAAGQPLRTAM